MKKIILLIAMLVFLSAPAWATDYLFEAEATWQQDAGSLPHLSHWVLYMQQGEEISPMPIPYSTGEGPFDYRFEQIIQAEYGQDLALTFWLTAVNFDGVESGSSNVVEELVVIPWPEVPAPIEFQITIQGLIKVQ